MYSRKIFTLVLFLSVLFVLFGRDTKQYENAAIYNSLAKYAVVQRNESENYLTVADVEKVTGLTGIKILPKNPSIGAGGDLNFATTDNQLVVMSMFLNASFYEQFMKQPGYFKEAVSGVGEEAFSGPVNNPQYVLIFRKGAHCVSLSSFFKLGSPDKSTTMLTMSQLIKLAKIIASRI